MENKKKKALEDFLEDNQVNADTKKVINTQREGLIERVDKLVVTQDGRQLLREQY